MSSSQSLRIAVLGVGNIGSTFAFQLAEVGHHDVTVIARPGSTRFQQLQRDKGIVNIQGKRVDVYVIDTLDEETPYDLVIITLLAHQVDAVLPALQRSASNGILFMFNNFEPERLRDIVGAHRCAFGMPFVQAYLSKDGKVNATIGSGGQKTKLSQQHWVDIFNAAGLPAVLEPNMLLWLRCHVPLCIAFESVSVAGMRRGGGASWHESMVLAYGIHESFKLIQGLGYELYPSEKVWLNKSPGWVVSGILWLLSRVKSFRELLSLGSGECRALVGIMLEAARLANIPVNLATIESMKPPVG